MSPTLQSAIDAYIKANTVGTTSPDLVSKSTYTIVNRYLDAGMSDEDIITLLNAVPGTTPADIGLAAMLYDVYCKAVGGVAHDGTPLPDWTQFRADPTKQKQSQAWIAVADFVFTNIQS